MLHNTLGKNIDRNGRGRTAGLICRLHSFAASLGHCREPTCKTAQDLDQVPVTASVNEARNLAK